MMIAVKEQAQGLTTFVLDQSEGARHTLPRERRNLNNKEGDDWPDTFETDRQCFSSILKIKVGLEYPKLT